MSKSQTILFVDDHHILYRAGTRRTVKPFKRYERNPVIVGRTEPWEVLVGWNSIYRNPRSGRYQLWYQAYTGDQMPQKTQDTVVCYAESDDGLNFLRPKLGLHPFKGHKQTNIILIGNGGRSYRYTNSVIVDPNDVPQRRYKMASFDFPPPPHEPPPGLYTSFSPDGIHWTKTSKLPLSRVPYTDFEPEVPFAGERAQGEWPMPLRMSDALDVFFDPVRRVYAIYGKMWIDGPSGRGAWKHGMGRIESVDFVDWSKPELILTPDDDDPPWVEFHSAPVFFHKGCYFALIQVLDRAKNGGVIDIELALSRDGLVWDRPFRNSFVLGRSEGKKFDSGALLTNATPVVLEDEIRFYYGGYSRGATGADDKNMSSGIAMASIPLDRFAGLRPVPISDQPTLKTPLENIGQVTLKPMDLSACRQLTLNADASQGAVRVEVLDGDGYRIRGYTKEDAVPIRGDDLRHAVRWQNRGLPELPKGKYMLRLHLENAAVFALGLPMAAS